MDTSGCQALEQDAPALLHSSADRDGEGSEAIDSCGPERRLVQFTVYSLGI